MIWLKRPNKWKENTRERDNITVRSKSEPGVRILYLDSTIDLSLELLQPRLIQNHNFLYTFLHHFSLRFEFKVTPGTIVTMNPFKVPFGRDIGPVWPCIYIQEGKQLL